LDYLQSLGETVKTASRCGLGQTSPNPILTTLANFRDKYEALVQADKNRFQRTFDIRSALREAESIAGHKSEIYHEA
jgi:[NiFe] hydrogenase diaphorase moiety large subunit